MSAKPLLGWDGKPISVKPEPDPNVNPCIAEYGPYPYDAGKTMCKSCAHIIELYAARTVYECALRGIKGRHRARWPACAKFEERTEGPIPVYDKRG